MYNLGLVIKRLQNYLDEHIIIYHLKLKTRGHLFFYLQLKHHYFMLLFFMYWYLFNIKVYTFLHSVFEIHNENITIYCDKIGYSYFK